MRRTPAFICATAAATAALVAMGPASAAPTVSDPIVDGLIGPLQLDVQKDGVYVAQSFAGLLTKVRRDGSTTDLVSEQGEIAGVAVRGRSIAYTFSGGTEEDPVTQLKLRHPGGHIETIADLYRFEKTHNPDRNQTYGWVGLSKSCQTKMTPEIDPAGGGKPYQGIVDSHPYALANAPGGGWYVAEAAGNEILKVSPKGHISVVYLAKPQPTRVSADEAEAAGLPACVAGHVLRAEPVPTDVELFHGSLYFTQLPGGDESGGLGERGSVMRIDPKTGHATKVAHGIGGATNLAIGPKGKIYVTEIFSGAVSVIRPNGTPRTLVDLPTPSGLEWSHGKLFVLANIFDSGQLLTVRP